MAVLQAQAFHYKQNSDRENLAEFLLPSLCATYELSASPALWLDSDRQHG